MVQAPVQRDPGFRFEAEGIEKGIRLLGITLTNLDPITYENIRLPLWENTNH